MKSIRFIFILSTFVALFFSCSTDVDLYAEYQDVPIIYALLNSRADTNYVKITHAFCGTNDDHINANEVALIYDSSNYPGKLDVRIMEMKNRIGGSYEPTGRVLVLDTMTIHNKKVGTFYAPDQIVYYTAEPFNAGTEDTHYKYRLQVVVPDGDTLTAQTVMVGNEELRILTYSLNFEETVSNAMNKIMFRADGVARLYEVSIQFNYREQKEGQAMKHKSVSRSFGTRTLDEFIKVEGTENTYYLECGVGWLFYALAEAIGNDTVVDPEHPNVVRYFDNIVISLGAAGDDLYYYYAANYAQQISPVGFVSVYSNIDGGYGLFSSRAQIDKECRLSKWTLRDLYGKTSWGFQEQ